MTPSTKVGGIHYFSPTGCSPFNPNVCNNIGWEVADATPYTGSGCPASELCRDADVEFDRTLAGVSISRGRIAKPSVPPPGTSWAGADWRIVGEQAPIDDQFVTRVGRTTGSVGGTVVDFCVDVFSEGYLLLCQTDVEYAVAPQDGDSGAPVFMRVPGTNKDVLFKGIHWGLLEETNIGTFSSISNIQLSRELGPINTCDPLYPC